MGETHRHNLSTYRSPFNIYPLSTTSSVSSAFDLETSHQKHPYIIKSTLQSLFSTVTPQYFDLEKSYELPNGPTANCCIELCKTKL